MKEFHRTLDIKIAHFGVKIEARFSHLRSSETNLGNFLAHILRTEFEADVCLFTSGCVRLDC